MYQSYNGHTSIQSSVGHTSQRIKDMNQVQRFTKLEHQNFGPHMSLRFQSPAFTNGSQWNEKCSVTLLL